MKYYVEESLSNFKFWSGGADHADQLTHDELERLDVCLPDLLGDDPSDTAINDVFWFDFEAVVALLGLRLNASGDIIRGIDDVDGSETHQTVSDWAEDNGFELTDADIDALATAIHDADGMELDGDSVSIDDDIALECAEKLGFKLGCEDEDEEEEADEEDADEPEK